MAHFKNKNVEVFDIWLDTSDGDLLTITQSRSFVWANEADSSTSALSKKSFTL